MTSRLLLPLGLLGLGVVWFVLNSVHRLRKHVARARETGFHVVVSPFLPSERLFQIAYPLVHRILRLLPATWSEDWYSVTIPDWTWINLRKPFDKFGDTFAIAAPRGIMIYTSDADLITQVTSRREAFPKFLDDYKILAMLGDNVVTVEGATWRFHRKVTSASFNEKNAARVFYESIDQCQTMLGRWGERTVRDAEQETMTWALNIISAVGFGLRLLWPGQAVPENADAKLLAYGSTTPSKGHSVAFSAALATVLDKLLVLLLIPWSVLPRLPFETTAKAWDAWINYRQYMADLLRDNIAEVREDDKLGKLHDTGMDIMGHLVRSKYGRGAQDAEAIEPRTAASTRITTKKGATSRQTTLTDDEIISNAFIMLLAGHETTANTLHFTLLELAQNPSSQRRLQHDIDSIVGRDSDPATWRYEDTVNSMMASMLGACMNETLRWMPPVPEVPKMVTPHKDQPVILEDGRKVDLPAGANLRLAVIGAHRNPRFWPGKPSRVKGTEGEDDLDDWVPERWFRSGVRGKGTANRQRAAPIIADLAEKVETETSTVEEISTQFRPVRGSFIPFSDGSRSCLGRRMAQVELVAALAVVFQRHSVELDVEEWARNDEVEALSDEEKVALYEKARTKARETIRTAAQIITLKLHGRHVPIKLVPRGQERFVGLVDV